MDFTIPDIPGNPIPVPWVPVAIAPEMVWLSIPPIFKIARSRSSRSRFSFCMLIPDSISIRLSKWQSFLSTCLSMESTWSSLHISTRYPSESAISENECPEPMALTLKSLSSASLMICIMSCKDSGRKYLTGVTENFLMVFFQVCLVLNSMTF